MSEETNLMLDVGTLFHNLLFAYEKAVKKILGSGEAVFVHPTLEILKRIDEKRGSRLMKGKSLEEAWANLSNFFLRGNIVKEFSFKKIGTEKYVLRVDGCVLARHIHEELNPKDVACPYALIAMSIFQKFTGKKVKVTESVYFKEGTETTIEPL
jgi:hypothetical protein